MSDYKPKNHNRLKCFNCFGLGDSEQYCNDCGGTGFVTEEHPMAILLNEVFQKKIGSKIESTKEATWNEFEEVQTIRQEQEELDERKIICDLCNKECDINYKYFCQCCECFYVCVKCADQKKDDIDHQHPLATNRNIKKSLVLLKRTSSSQFGSNKTSDLNTSLNRSQKGMNTDQIEKCDRQYFNVCDIIEKEISHTYENVAQNIFDPLSETISDNDQREFQMISSLGKCQKKLNEIQSSDKGVKPMKQCQQTQNSLTKSFSQSHSRLIDDSCIQVQQSIDFSNSQADSLKKSIGIGNRQSFGFAYQHFIQQNCNNCGLELKDVYSICRTCENLRQSYKICSQCEDKSSYVHEKHHKMEMMLGNLLGRGSDMVSKRLIQSDEDEEDNMKIYIPQLAKKKSSLEKRPPKLQQSPFDDMFQRGNKSFCKMKSSGYIGNELKIIKKSFQQDSVVNVDCEGLFESVDLKELQTICLVQKKSSLQEVNNSMQTLPHPSRFTHGKNKSRVGFAEIGSEDEENVDIAYAQSQTQSDQLTYYQRHNLQENLVRNSRSSQKGFKGVKSMIFQRRQTKQLTSSPQKNQKSVSNLQSGKITQQRFSRNYQSEVVEQTANQTQKLEFIFHQFYCNQCGIGPIKNIKHHCLQCEDFDVCDSCYNDTLLDKHNHNFQKVDGRKKLLEKKNIMLQKKDLNKGRQSLIRSTNIGMLANSKKTVEMMKNSVFQLNNSVANLTKSYVSHADFYDQKVSFKGKLQYC